MKVLFLSQGRKRRNLYTLLVTVLPARFRGWLKVVPSLYESRMTPWAKSCLIDLKVVRHGGHELFSPPASIKDWARSEMSYPTRYAYVIKQGFVSLPRGRICVAGRWVGESFGNLVNASCEVLFLKLFSWVARLRGRIIRLPECEGGYVYCRCDGYFHFVLESLVSLLYALQMRPNACVVVREAEYRRTAYFRQYIELLRQRGWIKDVRVVDADCIIAPELAFAAYEPDSGLFCRSTVDLLREALLQKEDGRFGQRKIFLTRKGKRQFVNQRELERLAMDNGYEVIDTDGMSVEEQIKLFGAAAKIIANHGAGLINLAYCKAGVSVTELFSPKWLNDCYFRLSTLGGLSYSCIIAGDEDGWGSVDFPK